MIFWKPTAVERSLSIASFTLFHYNDTVLKKSDTEQEGKGDSPWHIILLWSAAEQPD